LAEQFGEVDAPVLGLVVRGVRGTVLGSEVAWGVAVFGGGIAGERADVVELDEAE